MRTLEEELKLVDELKKGISSVIILQEGRGHYEQMDIPRFSGSFLERSSVLSQKQYYVVDTPQKDIPDEERRKEARTDLGNLYFSSPYLTARFMAGRALGYSPFKILNDEIKFYKANHLL
jgi:hypothetical protein